MRFRPIYFLALMFALLVPPAMAQFDFAPSKATETGVANVSSVQPGVPFYAGIEIDNAPGWHTYWRNPGSVVGTASTITWNLPEGFTAGDLIYPTPHYEVILEFPTHVYSGTIYHIAKITPPADLEPGSEIVLNGRVDILVCDATSCETPKDRSISIKLPVSADAPEPSQYADAIEATLDDSPLRLPKWPATATAEGDSVVISVTVPDGATVPTEGLYLFPEARDLVVDTKEAQSFEIDGNTLKISIAKGEKFAGGISGLLHAESDLTGNGNKTVYVTTASGSDSAIDYPVRGMADSPVPSAETETGSPELDLENLSAEQEEEVRAAIKTVATWVNPGADSGKSATNPLMIMLWGGFIGGMILNLMPCVFPVLGIKIMGFVSQAGEDKSKIRKHGLVFAGGVLISLWLLVGVLLGIKYILGSKLSWGFQLQDPIFLAVMIIIMVVFGLNLAGLFEIGTSLASAGSGLQQKHGYSGSFFSGVLAVLIATPCTGPFMGPAIGFALTSSTFNAFAVFTALGLGLALPYVVLSCFPYLIQKLPKPGPWMVTLKQFMAFPMFATAIWFIGVFGKVTGQGAVTWMLFGLVTLAFGLWILGRYSTPINSGRTKGIARLATLVVVVGGLSLTALAVQKEPEASGFAEAKEHYGLTWHPFDPREIVEVRASGRPIFIDFTADS